MLPLMSPYLGYRCSQRLTLDDRDVLHLYSHLEFLARVGQIRLRQDGDFAAVVSQHVRLQIQYGQPGRRSRHPTQRDLLAVEAGSGFVDFTDGRGFH